MTTPVKEIPGAGYAPLAGAVERDGNPATEAGGGPTKRAGRMMKYLEDLVLAFLQRRCEHPDNMVAVDILEGCVDHLEVS